MEYYRQEEELVLQHVDSSTQGLPDQEALTSNFNLKSRDSTLKINRIEVERSINMV